MGLVDDKPGRDAFRRVMQKRVADITDSDKPMEADDCLHSIRRGWFFGGDGFRDELLDKLNGVIGVKGKRESFDGAQTQLHDSQEAGKLLVASLLALGLVEATLEKMKKNCPEKRCLAWLIRKRTGVSNEWIRQHLHMGKASNFAALLKRVDEGGGQFDPIIRKLKNIKISD